jgi:hypothetical protein
MVNSLRTLAQALLWSLLVPTVLLAQDAGLIERAKRDGRVVLYTSLAPTESGPHPAAIEKK